MKKGAKLNRRQIGLQKAESGEMARKEVKTRREERGETERGRQPGRGKRSRRGYETNSDLIWHVYDSVFFSLFFFFFQALRYKLELDWAVA